MNDLDEDGNPIMPHTQASSPTPEGSPDDLAPAPNQQDGFEDSKAGVSLSATRALLGSVARRPCPHARLHACHMRARCIGFGAFRDSKKRSRPKDSKITSLR